MADVIANSVWQMLLPLRLMLLPTIILLADVIANCMWQMVLPLRLMLLPIKIVLADVIAKIVADVITTILNVLADGIAKWQME